MSFFLFGLKIINFSTGILEHKMFEWMDYYTVDVFSIHDGDIVSFTCYFNKLINSFNS